MTTLTVHASCVVIGEAGVLIRGEAGSGKSSLALALVRDAERRGVFARLVADDRTRLTIRAGRLVARPVAAIAATIEMRGLGVVRIAHESAAVVQLVVDCLPDWPERLPQDDERRTTIASVALPRLGLKPSPDSPGIVLAALALAKSVEELPIK